MVRASETGFSTLNYLSLEKLNKLDSCNLHILRIFILKSVLYYVLVGGFIEEFQKKIPDLNRSHTMYMGLKKVFLHLGDVKDERLMM